ncbi:MAG: hypothetical protein FJ263_00920 [Planctomycetes bacterium]|nr:hypothetical protein [Planctomycetota bacterium]
MRIRILDSRLRGNDKARIYSVLEEIRRRRPRSREQLRRYVKVFLGIDVPGCAVCEGHDAPLDYLWHSYSCDFAGLPEAAARNETADCIVWAGRGGGKTKLAAAATLLDSIFKPGCKTRILAGSLDQSCRMYDYLRDYVEGGFAEFVRGKANEGKCRFVNGSDVEVLSHSARSVRGRHIHKLRCDEVELFRSEVYATGAQFITKSDSRIRGALEVFSTMHQPYGIMRKLIDATGHGENFGGSMTHPTAMNSSVTKLFRWCVWEAIERCGERSCSQCVLWGDCGGRAKRAAGHLRIDDVIDQMRRSSRAAFETEMLCLRPKLDNVVFAEFEPRVHIAEVGYDANLPLYRAMDFGYSNPFVCLWIQADAAGGVRVIDEYMKTRAMIAENGAEVLRRTPGGGSKEIMTFCDPAGACRNDVTGTSAVRELAAMGIRCKHRPSAVLEGLELIRRALKAGDGKSRLVISPKCQRLIEAMRCYHYPPCGGETPDKDGVYDHPIDALRYFFVNYGRQEETAGLY